MIDTLLRGIPYYIIFIILFIIYKKYNIVLYYLKNSAIRGHFLSETAYERHRKRLLIYAYIVLLLFFGFRGYVYTDFINYKPFFDKLDVYNLQDVMSTYGWEHGFIIYAALCKMIIPDYFAWNVISSAIDFFLLYKVFERYSNNHILSLMTFFVIGSTALEFNVLRNAKAIFLFLYALKYIEERNKWKYFSIISIACFFHTSSIIYFPLYFILHKKWSKWVLWCIYIGGALIMFLHIGIVSDIVSRISFAEDSRIEHLVGYLDESTSYFSLYGNIERFVTMFIVIMLYNKLAKHSNNYMFVNMYILLYASFTVCSESNVMVQRFQYMFIASFWILYPLLLEYAKLHKNQIVYLCITALLFMKLSVIAGDPNLKYENVLTGVSNYTERVIYTERNLSK